MAFRITQTSLTDNYSYISKLDEAVNKDDPEFAKKWETYLDGMGDPPLRENAQPSVWHFRQLSVRQLARIAHRPEIDQAVAAMAMSLVKVDNFLDEKGRAIVVEFEYEDGVRVASSKTLDLILQAGGYHLIMDLAYRAQRGSTPNPK